MAKGKQAVKTSSGISIPYELIIETSNNPDIQTAYLFKKEDGSEHFTLHAYWMKEVPKDPKKPALGNVLGSVAEGTKGASLYTSLPHRLVHTVLTRDQILDTGKKVISDSKSEDEDNQNQEN